LLPFKSFLKKRQETEHRRQKIDKKEVTGRKGTRQNLESDRKEDVSSTQYAEGGDAIYTDRPSASPLAYGELSLEMFTISQFNFKFRPART